MSTLECPSCHSMAAHPQRSTRASVIDYNSPDCVKYEFFTEYACANCLTAFARSMSSHSSSAPFIQNITSTESLSEWISPVIGSSSSYNYRSPCKIVNYVARNRARCTAKRTDIDKTTSEETVKEDCCITEMNMEMKK